MQLELKTNAISVHSNLGCATHGHLGILMMDTKYATLSNIPYAFPIHPGIILIPNNDTYVASYEPKQVYDENLRFFTKYADSKRL